MSCSGKTIDRTLKEYAVALLSRIDLFIARRLRWLVWGLGVAALLVLAEALFGGRRLPHGLAMAAIAWPFIAVLLLFRATRGRERFLREEPLPRFLLRKLRDACPQLTPRQCEQVEEGLRQFFRAQLHSGRPIAMPSRAVDALWRAFIQHPEAYRDWCRNARGGVLVHTPACALGRDAERNDRLRRAWYWACKDEDIDPRAPARLPLLFALDAELGFPGGIRYLPSPDDAARLREDLADGPSDVGGALHFGTDFGGERYSGSPDDFGGAESDGGGDDGGD